MHKPRLRKSILLLTLFVSTLLIFSSCSAVFKASVGGKVLDSESSDGIVDMEVFVYTNTTQRDSDWEQYRGGTFNPSSDAGYVARTNSDASGSFVINTVIWESKFPEFGKTADYKEIALLFYHEDYGLHKNSNPIWITSDSSNNSMVKETFSKVNQTTNVEIYLRDVATEALVDNSFDVHLSVSQDDEENATKKETHATIYGGRGTVAVTYPVELPKTKLTARATLYNSHWMQCDKEGVKIEDDEDEDEDAKPTIAGKNSEVTLYLKAGRHSFPLISGEIDSEERDGSEKDSPDNSLTVWLGERVEGIIALYDKAGAQTITRSEGTGANNSVIRHGIFSNLGSNMNWEDSEYPGKYATKEVLLIVDMDRDRKLSVGDCYYEFTIRSDHGQSMELGRLRWNSADQNESDLIKIVAEDLQ